MNASPARPARSRDFGFERRLGNALAGEVRFDAFTRGRYATDASIYQIIPVGVAFPKSADDVAAALTVAREHGVPVIARGGGTSQNGQPIGPVVSISRHLSRLNKSTRRARRQRVAVVVL